MNEHYADGSEFSPMVGQLQTTTDTLKTICQELFIGLSIAADEMKRGGDVTRLVEFLEGIAKYGNKFPYRGMTFAQIETFVRVARNLVAHRREEKKRIFLLTRINGETKIQHEEMGGKELLDVSEEPGSEETKSRVASAESIAGAALSQAQKERVS